MDGTAFLEELGFEVGNDFQKIRRNWGGHKSGVTAHHFGHLPCVFLMIGAQVEKGTWFQGPMGDFWKSFVHQSELPVFSFRPWIREVNMKAGDGIRREEPLDEVGGFDPDQPDIFEIAAKGFSVGFSQSSQKAFHSDQVDGRIFCGVLGEEGSITASEFHFDRGGGGEEIVDRDAFYKRGEGVDVGFLEKSRGHRGLGEVHLKCWWVAVLGIISFPQKLPAKRCSRG